MNKPQLRKWAKIKRSELDMDSLSLILAEKLKQTEEYKNANNIMIFYPLKDEVNLLSLLDDETKTFYLPKIDGDNLLCCKYKKGEPLCESSFHTMEPIAAPSPQPTPAGRGSNIFTPDLVIVPALACDKNNCRLGYGKGFYDRFLRVNKIKSIVCIPKQLVVETIYPDEFDIPVDKVIMT